MGSSINVRQRALYKVERALLNTNSDILFRRMTAVLTVNPNVNARTRFSLIIQNRLHLLLKVLLNSKFIAKSTYRLTRSRNLESVSDRSRSLVFACFLFLFSLLVVSNFFADRTGSLGFSDLLSYRLVFRSRIFQRSRIQLIDLRE